jgi:hypothetical protein
MAGRACSINPPTAAVHQRAPAESQRCRSAPRHAERGAIERIRRALWRMRSSPRCRPRCLRPTPALQRQCRCLPRIEQATRGLRGRPARSVRSASRSAGWRTRLPARRERPLRLLGRLARRRRSRGCDDEWMCVSSRKQSQGASHPSQHGARLSDGVSSLIRRPPSAPIAN